MKVKVGIIGATGYTGVVLTRLLINHPEVEIAYLSSEQHSEKQYYEVYPAFFDSFKGICKSLNTKEIAKKCDLVFLATPNNFSKNFTVELLKINLNIKVIDLSADLRGEKSLIIRKKQNIDVVYGLPEIYRSEIKYAQIVANPGCYPTSIILALAPAIKNKIIDLSSIIIDSKSGISGAGRGIRQDLHFCEVNESFVPYSLQGKHRHIGEIERELSSLAKKNIKVVFSPHLIPINRGIISTVYANIKNVYMNQEEIHKLYLDFYKDEFFIKVLPKDSYTNTKNVRYTNFCHINALIDERTNKLIIVTAIDNMVKGASGQAIQNMNIILGFNEKLGLDTLGQIP